MADRNYPSTDMFIYYHMRGCKFCYRGKSNFYKKYVKDIKRDGLNLILMMLGLVDLKLKKSKTMTENIQDLD